MDLNRNDKVSDPDDRVPGYLGRVLSGDKVPAGTCFQVEAGIIVTAYHVLNDLGADVVGVSGACNPSSSKCIGLVGDGCSSVPREYDRDRFFKHR